MSRCSHHQKSEGADNVHSPLGGQLPGHFRRVAINQQRQPAKLIELNVRGNGLHEIGGDPRLDAFRFTSQKSLANLRNDALIEAENHDVHSVLVEYLGEAEQSFLAKIVLRLDFKTPARLRQEAFFPTLAIRRQPTKQDVLAQMYPRSALLQPDEEDCRSNRKESGGENKEKPKGDTADFPL